MMRRILTIARKIMNITLATLFFSTCSSINAFADHDRHAGMIHFSGAIIHTSCSHTIEHENVKLNCLNDKADMVTHHVDLNKLTKVQGWNVLNGGRGEYFYNWVNEEKQLGMLTIKYI